MSGQADQISAELETFLSGVVSEVGVALVECLRDATPVKTGHASFNWIGAVGQAFRGIAGSNDSPTKSEQDSGLAKLRAYKLRDGGMFVTNNVHYVPIVDVIGPHAGFIRRGVEDAVDKVNRRFS